MKDQNKGMDNDVSEEEVSAVSETYQQQVNAYIAKSNINKSITDVSLRNENETYNSSMTNPSEGELRTPNVDMMDAPSTNLHEIDEENDSQNNVSDHQIVINTASMCILPENEARNISKQLVMPLDLMSEVFDTTSTSDSLSMHYALCGLWDFAGQKEFYGTHQAFLTSSAIYLVVADMDTEICKEPLELDGTNSKEDHKQDSMDSFKDLESGGIYLSF
ncbi:unnamed protein product [Mytilus edulis]|uniref:Uncharacterized protein n=1 Tax=Mytilus edulis TaxID=6550 RepID=A0A8S3U1T3_MYTED|nr:unnamed protein product [Mytilus edulis]